VRREFLQRLSAALHGTLGFYLRDAMREGSVWHTFLFLELWGFFLLIAPFCVLALPLFLVRTFFKVPFTRSAANMYRNYTTCYCNDLVIIY
jgi:hypothetical protein